MHENRPLGSTHHDAGVVACNADIRSIVNAHVVSRQGWLVADTDELWIHVERYAAAASTQGWKLHLSATVASAAEVLERALPVLMEEPCSFKVAATIACLDDLNKAYGGPSQVGKFVTVYPVDDAQAVRLAKALDGATAGMAGPRVPSDRALRPGSLVHYRYGAFAEKWMQTALGEVVCAMNDPSGELVPDRRTRWYHSPEWADDPFEADGVFVAGPPTDLMVAGRYLTASILGSSPGVTVRLVMDLEAGKRRVLKQARRDGQDVADPWEGPHGRLRHEAAVLALLVDDPHTPTVHDVFDEGDSLFVVMDHVAGMSLEHRVHAEAADAKLVSPAKVVSWAIGAAEAVGALHSKGLVYGDLKPPHLFVTDDDEIRLIDLESVSPAPAGLDGAIVGTPGYVSPQRARGDEPSVRDDIHSLGAVLLFLVTGVEPSLAPNRRRLLDRPLALFNPSLTKGMCDLISACLDPDLDARPRSTDEFCRLLRAVARSPRSASVDSFRARPALVADLTSRLCDERVDDWTMHRRDVDGGMAGVVLALAQAAPALDRSEVWGALSDRADWLVRSAPLPGGPLPGLYVGEAGVGAALLRAGQALEREDLVECAMAKGALVSAIEHRSPDLFNGSAGRLRFHLMLWEATGDGAMLDAARAAGDFLLHAAERPEQDQVEWRVPAGYESATGASFLGYAHGVAGIADAVADLYEATGEPPYRELAAAAGRRLMDTAIPVGDDDVGIDWPDVAGGSRGGALWCHGAAGVTRFLAHATRLDLFDGARAACLAGARATAAARRAGAGQCHGLAGNAEVLIDVYQATGEGWCLKEADQLVALMGAFLDEPDDLVPVSPRWIRSTDLMNGWAGLLTCALRLRSPERTRHVLSLDLDLDR